MWETVCLSVKAGRGREIVKTLGLDMGLCFVESTLTLVREQELLEKF